MSRLHARPRLGEPELARLRELITDTGAVSRIEQMIGARAAAACAGLAGAGIDGFVLAALSDLAARATDRAR